MLTTAVMYLALLVWISAGLKLDTLYLSVDTSPIQSRFIQDVWGKQKDRKCSRYWSLSFTHQHSKRQKIRLCHWNLVHHKIRSLILKLYRIVHYEPIWIYLYFVWQCCWNLLLKCKKKNVTFQNMSLHIYVKFKI